MDYDIKRHFNRGKKTEQIKLSVAPLMDKALKELAAKGGFDNVPEMLVELLEKHLIAMAKQGIVTITPESMAAEPTNSKAS